MQGEVKTRTQDVHKNTSQGCKKMRKYKIRTKTRNLSISRKLS